MQQSRQSFLSCLFFLLSFFPLYLPEFSLFFCSSSLVASLTPLSLLSVLTPSLPHFSTKNLSLAHFHQSPFFPPPFPPWLLPPLLPFYHVPSLSTMSPPTFAPLISFLNFLSPSFLISVWFFFLPLSSNAVDNPGSSMDVQSSCPPNNSSRARIRWANTLIIHDDPRIATPSLVPPLSLSCPSSSSAHMLGL